MQRYESSDQESTDDELPPITVRREPEAVGGGKYLRCEGCGAEVIGTSERKLVHYEDCAHVEPGDPTR